LRARFAKRNLVGPRDFRPGNGFKRSKGG